MEEKYMLAIKAGIFCGLVPAVAYIVYLLTLFWGVSGLFSLILSFIFLMAAVASGLLAIRYTRPLLRTIGDVMVVSGMAGAAEGITVGVIMAIAGALWQLAATDFAQNALRDAHYYFSLASSPWDIPVFIVIVAAFTAIISAVSSTIYVTSKVPVKL